MLRYNKVLVLDQEIVGLVAHAASVVLDGKACLGQLGLGKALAS